MKVVLEEEALAELMESVAWYEEREEGVGFRFFNDVHAALRRLPTAKLKPLKTSGVRNATVLTVGAPWPYDLVVVEQDDTRFVVAVAHYRRRADYWADRVRRTLGLDARAIKACLGSSESSPSWIG